MVDKITNPPSQKDLIDKVNELVDDKQDALVSGTNIKTINGTSILGSGNIEVGGGYTAGSGIDITNDVISVDNTVALKSDIPTKTSDLTNDSGFITASALNGYATETWIGQQGYITGITSSDVTTALGYTPYNASNPSGYITNSALVPYALSADLASVATSGSYDDLSNKPTIPAAQVNSDWNATSGVARILNKPTIPTVNNPTITFTQGGTTKGTITLNQLGDQTIAFDAGGGARNIGQIIQSTIPLTDAGLHLLDGSVIQGNGVYSDFVTYIAGLVSTYPNLFVTESDWQTSVTTYGVCGKFVYDSTNNTVRLPKITGFIEGTVDSTVLGDLIQAGLPNITGHFYGGSAILHAYGAFSIGNNPYKGNTSGSSNNQITFDASRSSSIYGNSTTVQPQTIKVLYYIVVATTTKTDIEVDIDNIATDLNGKADVDLSNVPNSKGILTESYVNGTSWYRVYSDGWCEQGGHYIHNNVEKTVTTTFIKTFIDTNYNLQITKELGSSAGTNAAYQFMSAYVASSKTTSQFQVIMTTANRLNGYDWQACGYIR